MNSSIESLIETARSEVGYLEKATNKQLDDKTTNIGRGNYTKYARDLVSNKDINPNPYVQGAAWCDMFVDWCFIKTFGLEEAKRLLIGWSAYTPTSAGFFIRNGQSYNKPEPGDIIFFSNSTRINHTGIVYKVDNLYVYTIEGNTSGIAGVDENGGGVHMKRYVLSYDRISMYGRPNYKEDDIVTQKEFDEKMEVWLMNRSKQEANPYVAISDFNAAKESGLTDGSRPQAFATRQEVAVMAYRAKNK